MFPIDEFDHADPVVARAIHAVMQAGYAVEARHLEVTDFVPLSRTVEQIGQARATFFGIRADFVELRRWTTEDGIPMITLQRG